MDEHKLTVLAFFLITVVALGGFYTMYKDTSTANVALRTAGQRFINGRGMAYSQPVMLCERLIGEGKIPKGFEYETTYDQMVNRFGANNCVDGTTEIGYWCCRPSKLGVY
ncbi:hypothetical protein GF358_01850 [Candidatus Woesearchaeota archaeon]|nr:hypothetical protein [Candidatus Woesearchaeota archaeon]